MTIGVYTFELHLPGSRSLKNKRQVVKRLKDRLRSRLNVAVAEIGDHADRWQRAGLAVVSVANGRDAFLAGATMNIPIYRKRLDAGVREAEARSVAAAREYDSLRDQTHEEVKDVFAQLRSQRDLLYLFREDIIPKADQTFRVSMQAGQRWQTRCPRSQLRAGRDSPGPPQSLGIHTACRS